MGTNTAVTEDVVRRRLLSDFDAGFTMLVEEYQPGIYSGALRLTGHRQDAQEIAQDTFLRAYGALDRYEAARIESLRVRPWLWTIAINLVRSRASRTHRDVPLETHHQPAFEDSDVLDDQVWNDRLARLNPNQRTAVVLRHVLDLPISEIADILGRPQGTVKADISRGLSRLRTTIESERA
jgi:RNA polymerase sigma-70 factor, ECF subfamily